MIGLLELRRRKLQFGLIALVVTLIAYLVLMINGLGVGLNALAGSALKSFNADGIAYSDRAGLSVIRSELSGETLAAIAARNGAVSTAPIGYVAANYRRSDGSVRSAAFLGYLPGTIGEPGVVRGRTLNADDRFAILADTTFLDAAGLSVGDSISVTVRLATTEFEIVGAIDEGSFFFQPAVYVLLDTWRELKYGSVDGDLPAASIVLLKGKEAIGTPGPGYEIVDKKTAFDNIEGVQGQQSTVTALRLFGFIIGGLVVAAFFYVLTLQKIAQMGVLKAIGASSSFVLLQLFVQVLLVTVFATAIAVVLAWATDGMLQRLPDSVPIAFTARTYMLTVAGQFFVSILGTVFAARRVLQVDPLIALGQQQ